MKKIVAIVGPTASGKTQLSLELAEYFQLEIINADSRQIYLDFNIATAKPSLEQLNLIKHHLVDFWSPFQGFTVKDFQIHADTIIQNSSKPMILSGGTGLYFQAVEKNLDELPDIPSEVRNFIQKNYEKQGICYLIEELKKNDPKILEIIDKKNPRRLSRALEVFMVSGKSLLEFWSQENLSPRYSFLWIGLDLGWAQLEKNIQSRIENMFQNGLIQETEYLLSRYPTHLKAFESIGYYEVIEFLNGKKKLSEVKEQIYFKTRQYAKRQLTWFRKNSQIIWLQEPNFQKAKEILENFF